MTKASLIKELERRKRSLGTWAALATALGVSAQSLHDCKEGHRNPSAPILRALNLRKQVVYLPIEKA